MSLTEHETPSAEVEAGTRDVVFAFFRVDWRVARRRELTFAQDRLFDRLLRDPRVGRLVVASHHRSILAAARSRLRDRQAPPSKALVVEPLRLRRRDPTAIRALEAGYRRYDRALERAAHRHGLRHPAVITSNPLLAAFAPLDWASTITYYATDDWRGHYGHAAWRDAYERAQARLAAGDRRICAVSAPLLEALAGPGERLLLPNGIAPEEWLEPASPPSWLAELPAPRLLYAGTLDARIDVALLASLARELPDASIILLGPRGAQADALDALARLPNVTVHGAVGRRELAAAVAGANVCLLPHTTSQLTRSMSPLKVYEYLAAGRPVASVDLPPVHGIDPAVFTATDTEGFIAAVHAALVLGPAAEDARRAFIVANSWSRRHDELLAFALG